MSHRNQAFASGYGSGLIKTPFTRAKTAALAPMPKASVTATGTEKPGRRNRRRSAWRTPNPTLLLLIPQSHYRIELRRSARGEIARHERRGHDQ